MLLNRLLIFSLEVSDEVIDLVKLISVCSIAALIVILFILHRAKSAMDTRSIVFAAICIALSFALSFIKISMPFGGSITFASFVPILVYSYFYGPVKGLIAGLVYGLLQFIQDSWFLTPVQFILDYILAFSSIALAGVFRNVLMEKGSVIAGAATVGFVRLIMHILAGIIFFNAGIVYDWIPQDTALLYSTIYNVIYVVPDILISIAVIVFMLYRGYFKSLDEIMNKK